MPSGRILLLSALRNRILRGEEQPDSRLVYHDILWRASEIGARDPGDFRGLGLGSLTSALCVRDCVDKGLRFEWHCRESNSASIGVAEKIGFSDPVHYKSLFLNLTKGL